MAAREEDKICSVFFIHQRVYVIFTMESAARSIICRRRSTRYSVPYGYEEIETPSIEYFEVFSKEVGTVPSRDLYKFFDREGNTLVLRPDFTPSVSRACATYFNPDKQVVTLCYTGNTFVNNSSYQGTSQRVPHRWALSVSEMILRRQMQNFLR